MIRSLTTFLVVIFLAGCASTSSEQTTADENKSSGPVVEATAAAMEAKDPDQVVCRREQQTGSKFTTRVCRTRAEIEERAEKDQNRMTEGNSRGGGSNCAINPSSC